MIQDILGFEPIFRRF